MNYPYDQDSDPGDESLEWMSDDELWEDHCRRRIKVMQCAAWRTEIFQHYTTLDAYADQGIEDFEELLRGK